MPILKSVPVKKKILITKEAIDIRQFPRRLNCLLAEVIATAAIPGIQGNTVPEIAEHLARMRENVIGLNTQKMADSQEVTLLADKAVPFEIVKKIMSTSTSEGYGKISLAVLQKATQLASVE